MMLLRHKKCPVCGHKKIHKHTTPWDRYMGRSRYGCISCGYSWLAPHEKEDEDRDSDDSSSSGGSDNDGDGDDSGGGGASS